LIIDGRGGDDGPKLSVVILVGRVDGGRDGSGGGIRAPICPMEIDLLRSGSL
jgi:hypothetical protein